MEELYHNGSINWGFFSLMLSWWQKKTIGAEQHVDFLYTEFTNLQKLGIALKWIEVIPKPLFPKLEEYEAVGLRESLCKTFYRIEDVTMLILIEVIRNGKISEKTRSKAEGYFLGWVEEPEGIDVTSMQDKESMRKPAKRQNI
jgi:hypothetical protein